MSLKKNTVEPVQKMTLDITENMSKVLVDYALSRSPSPSNLANFNKFLGVLDVESYRYNYEIYNRLYLSKLIVNSRINDGISHPEILRNKIIDTDPTLKEVCDAVTWKTDTLESADAKAVSKYIDNKVQYYSYFVLMPEIVEMYQASQKKGFDVSENEVCQIRTKLTQVANMMENSATTTNILRRLSFSDPDVGDVIMNIAEKEQASSAILQTGIRQLNANLGPGFRGKRLYTILGPSGKFKSGTLLNLCDQIRQFNPQLEELVDGKRNTILFVTAENTIDETIERIYAMYGNQETPFLEATPQQIKETILKTGRYNVEDNDRGIDVEMRYFTNLEISTADLYKVIDDLNSNGRNVICLILDYIKRIRSVAPTNGDEVLRQGFVAKELKTIAVNYNIPVITAQQINRSGNAIIDSAMRDGKSDLLRFVGNSDIGGAWAVIEESDVVMLINLERHVKEGKLYLSFKFTKRRYKQQGSEVISDYFNHPFSETSEMKLMTDLDKEYSVSIMSLASDLETVDMDELEKKTQERPTIVKRVGSSAILDSLGISKVS